MQPMRINFINSFYYGRRQLSVILNLLALFMLLMAFWQFYTVVQLRAAQAQLQSQLTEINAVRDNTAQTEKEVDIAAEVASYQPFFALVKEDSWRWTRLLTRLEEVLPAGVSLTSLAPDHQDQSIMLQGEARDLEHLSLFIDQLNSTDFGHILLLGQRAMQVTDMQGEKRPALGFSLRLEGGL